MKKGTRIFIDILVIAVLVVIDQLTKQAAEVCLMDRPAYDIIPEVLQLYYLPGGNTGAAWGLFSGHQLLFITVTILVVAGIILVLVRMPLDKKYSILRVLLVFIAAGGIGNMIDRALLGSVRDFIYIKIINFPIFNVADMYVSCSVVIMLFVFLLKYKDEDIKELEDSIRLNKQKTPASDS